MERSTNAKTVLCLMLALIMALSLVPLGVYAANEYGVRLNGNEITKSKTSGSGWSFDGDRTLSVTGKIECEIYNEEIPDLPQQRVWGGKDIVENYGLDGLIVDFVAGSRLYVDDDHLLELHYPSAVYAKKDTVITGKGGSIEVKSDSCFGIIADGAELTIRDARLDVLGDEYTICGRNGAKLVLNNAELTIKADSNGKAAVAGFDGGIELIGCTIKQPEGGRVKDGAIVNPDGTPAKNVVIEPYPNPFTDVPEGKWYTEAALWCNYKGYMTGTSASTFAPDAAFTRAMFVTVLARIDGADTSACTGSSFYDVPEGKWYSKPIQWAYLNGYAAGTGGGGFDPDHPVTREQLAQFLYNYSQINGYDTFGSADISGYPDAVQVANYAENAVKWAVYNGLISGVKAGSTVCIKPKGAATRAQVALIVKNYVETIAN